MSEHFTVVQSVAAPRSRFSSRRLGLVLALVVVPVACGRIGFEVKPDSERDIESRPDGSAGDSTATTGGAPQMGGASFGGTESAGSVNATGGTLTASGGSPSTGGIQDASAPSDATTRVDAGTGSSGGASGSGGTTASGGAGGTSTTWQTPVVVPELAGTSNDRDVTLTADRLEMYFRSDRPGTSGSTDLWMTTRATTSTPWSTPVQPTGLNTKATELTPELSPDGLTIWFSANRTGAGTVGSFDIYVSTRPSRGGAWTSPTIVTEVSSTAVDFAPTPFPDFLTMMLASQRTGGAGGDDIWISTRPNTGALWQNPQFVKELSTAADDSGAFPVDANDIYLSSKITGDQEIFVSRRASAAVPFGAPVRIPELGSPASDEAPWVSSDELDVFFSSDRTGTYQIYESMR